MPARFRPLLVLLLATATALFVAACGSDDAGTPGKEASADTSVDTLLKNTFTGKKKVESGKLELNLRVNAKGAEGINGPITIKLGGPFHSQGAKKVPKFDIDFSFEGAGQSIAAGITSTGTKGFVNYKGTEYIVSDQIFKQLRAGIEEAQTKGNTSNQSLSTLGLNPRNWLTNAKNAGEADVGGDDTIKITGGVDVPKLLDDVNTALAKARELGVQGGENLPSKLTEAQKKQVIDAVKDPKVEIYTGKDDSILRKIVLSLGIVAPEGTQGGGSADIKFDLSLTGLNEDQEIAEPKNAKPFDQLISQFGGLGNLGGSGSSGSSGSGSSSAGSQKNLEEYSKCVTEAGGDATKATKCADILSKP